MMPFSFELGKGEAGKNTDFSCEFPHFFLCREFLYIVSVLPYLQPVSDSIRGKLVSDRLYREATSGNVPFGE